MQQYELPFSHWVLGAVLAAAGGAAWAQGAEAPAAPVPLIAEGESLPPRFVLCQREVGAQAGDRKALMRSNLLADPAAPRRQEPLAGAATSTAGRPRRP